MTVFAILIGVTLGFGLRGFLRALASGPTPPLQRPCAELEIIDRVDSITPDEWADLCDHPQIVRLHSAILLWRRACLADGAAALAARRWWDRAFARFAHFVMWRR